MKFKGKQMQILQYYPLNTPNSDNCKKNINKSMQYKIIIIISAISSGHLTLFSLVSGLSHLWR